MYYTSAQKSNPQQLHERYQDEIMIYSIEMSVIRVNGVACLTVYHFLYYDATQYNIYIDGKGFTMNFGY